MRCRNCGAPMRGNTCEYCGTDGYSKTEKDYGQYITIPIDGKEIRCYIGGIQTDEVCRITAGYVTESRYIYKITLISDPVDMLLKNF